MLDGEMKLLERYPRADDVEFIDSPAKSDVLESAALFTEGEDPNDAVGFEALGPIGRLAHNVIVLLVIPI